MLTNQRPICQGRPKKDRPYKTVIRKLPLDIPTEDIQDDLLDKHFSVIDVKQMYVRDQTAHQHRNLPLFLVTLKRNCNIQELFNLEYLCHCKISTELYRPRKFQQCYRCQRFIYSQFTCYMKLRCVNCADEHLTAKFTKKARTDPAKCANCGQDHPVNYNRCKRFKKHKMSRASPSKIPLKTAYCDTTIFQDSRALQLQHHRSSLRRMKLLLIRILKIIFSNSHFIEATKISASLTQVFSFKDTMNHIKKGFKNFNQRRIRFLLSQHHLKLSSVFYFTDPNKFKFHWTGQENYQINNFT